MYHNLMMIKFTALVCATVLIFGCAEDKEISPAFPEIKNPLDDSNEKQNALELATEVDQLVFSEESGLNTGSPKCLLVERIRGLLPAVL